MAKEDAEAPDMIRAISMALSCLPEIKGKEHIAEYSTHLRHRDTKLEWSRKLSAV